MDWSKVIESLDNAAISAATRAGCEVNKAAIQRLQITANILGSLSNALRAGAPATAEPGFLPNKDTLRIRDGRYKQC